MSSVLVIDDDPDFRAMISTVGQMLNVPVIEAADCCSGLEILEQNPANVKLVLLDYLMPGFTPVECSQRIVDSAAPLTPIVLVTAAANPADRAQELNLSQWISKPFDIKVLYDLMQKPRPA